MVQVFGMRTERTGVSGGKRGAELMEAGGSGVIAVSRADCYRQAITPGATC
jgi:hypothetical protein